MAANPSLFVEGIGELVYFKRYGFWACKCSLPELAKEAPVLRQIDQEDRKIGWANFGPDEQRLRVLDYDNKGLQPQQLAALQNLATSRAKICKAVLRCRREAEPKKLRGQRQVFCISVNVTDLYWKKIAWLEFTFIDDIDPEHGSNVAYHPDQGCHWTSNAYETVTDVDEID